MQAEMHDTSVANAVEGCQQYVGLVNQGSTCYLNSVIQALFHLPAFRRTLYSMPHPERDPIILALRNIFSLLDCLSSVVSTKELTDAFGWGANDAWMQHDVHEMMQKLFDRLETICKGTPQENFIRDLFYGELTYITRTVDGLNYVSYRNEGFYDVELPVKGVKSIYDSFDLWVKPERIEGVSLEINKGEPASTHTVERSQCFVRLPPVLLIHPNRVEFSMETFTVKILLGMWDFSVDLDLEKYVLPVKEGEESKNVLGSLYELRSVVVHQGMAQSGHYFTYVRFENNWVCFNDMYVNQVSEEDVMSSASGDGTGITSGSGGYVKVAHERATLLVYVNKSVIKDILAEFPIPPQISEVAKNILAHREIVEKERYESIILYYIAGEETILEALEDSCFQTNNNILSITVPVSVSLEGLYTAIAEDIGETPDRIRVWVKDTHSIHPHMEFRLYDKVEAVDGILFVEVLPDTKDAMLLQTSRNEDFFALVRILEEDSLGPCGIVHTREELEYLLSDEEEGMRCWIYQNAMNLFETTVDKVSVGSNIILAPISIPQENVFEVLRLRKFKDVDVFIMDNCRTGFWTRLGTIRLDMKSSYRKGQEMVHDLLVQANRNPPRSPDYIGFHCYSASRGRGPSFSVFPLCLLNSSTAKMDDCMYNPEGKKELLVSILPAPLSSLDPSRIVLFNIGGGVRPIVYVEGRSYKLEELFSLALKQISEFLPDNYWGFIAERLRRGIPVLRLILMPRDSNQFVIFHKGSDVLSTSGVYLIDVLAEVKKGESRVDVIFCDRRFGEKYFGFPTNIAVADSREETGAAIAQRVAAKLQTSPSAEEIGRWIVAVKGQSGTVRTMGPKDVLRSVMKEINEGLECFLIDRPRSYSLDGYEDARRNAGNSIVIRDRVLDDVSSDPAKRGSTY